MTATLSDIYPHGRVHDGDRLAGTWVAHPARRGPGEEPCLDVLGISRMGGHLAVHRTSSPLGATAAAAAMCASRSTARSLLASGPFPADLRDDARAVVAMMAATLAGDTRRDWFTPRADDVATDLRGIHAGLSETGAFEAARAWVRAIHADVAAFLGTLDPEAVAMSGRARVRAAFPGQAWGAFDRTFAGAAPLARALGWLPDMPVLLAMLSRDHPGELAACATRDELSTLVTARLRMDGEVPDRTLRALSGALDAMSGLSDEDAVTLRDGIDATGHDGDKLLAAVDLMRGLPPNWIPRDDPEWLACLGTGHQVMRTAARMTLAPASHVHLVGAGRGWRDLERRMARACGVGSVTPARTRAALDGIEDVVDSFARQVAAPVVALSGRMDRGETLSASTRRRLADAAARILLSGRSLPRLVEWSTRWHGRQAGIQARLEALHRGKPWATGWTPAFPDASVHGIDVSVLRDAAALSAEGDAMRHCVGGYSPECLAGTSRILSLRRRGVRLSTAELRAGDDGVALVQHRGPGNADPDPTASAALASYLAGLNDGTRPWSSSDLEPAPDDGTSSLARDAGYEWWRPGHVEAALEAWETTMPRATRCLDTKGWASAFRAASGDGPGWAASPFGHRDWPWTRAWRDPSGDTPSGERASRRP